MDIQREGRHNFFNCGGTYINFVYGSSIVVTTRRDHTHMADGVVKSRILKPMNRQFQGTMVDSSY